MRRNRVLFLALVSLVAIGGLLLFPTEVWAQRGGPGGAAQGFQYVVKFICGEVDDNDVDGIPGIAQHGQFLAAGEYFTVINIHNPNEETAWYGDNWFKKIVTDYFVVQTGPGEATPQPQFVAQKPADATHVIAWVNQDTLGNTIGTPNPPRQVIRDFSLSRDEAAQVNCKEIREVLKSIFDFGPANVIKGFVIIYSKLQLDVTAVYSACEQDTEEVLDCGEVETINVQRIEANGIAPPAGIGLPRGFPQTTQPANCPAGGCQYVVKFVCGEINETTASGWVDETPISGLTGANRTPLGNGEYYTDINVHNPNPISVKVNKKITMDDPIPELHGPLVSPETVTLEVDDAIQINCREIRRRLNKPFPGAADETDTDPTDSDDAFIKGYVVLFSRQKLDIVAAYTVCPPGKFNLGCDGGSLPVTSLEVRYGCREPGCPNDKNRFLSNVTPPSALLPSGVSSLGTNGELRLKLREMRFSVPLESAQLQVFSLSGQLLYDSGPLRTTTLSWKPLMNGRPLANGVYIYVVTLKDVLGNVARQVNKFVYLRSR